MPMSSNKPAISEDFGVAFERMCNFIAISQTKTSIETIENLIQQCFIILPEEKFTSIEQISQTINILFGLEIEAFELRTAFDRLLEARLVLSPNGTNYVLDASTKLDLQARLDEATALENRVKSQWFEELAELLPAVPQDKMWLALRQYLAKSFRRHGLQAIAYLDPNVESPDEYSNGLSALLRKSVLEIFPTESHLQQEVSNAISKFLASVGSHVDRVKYIAQLADGAFNYYSLSVDPEVAEQFRNNLQSLTIFLDTNFLLGILDLSANPLVEVSNRVLEWIETFSLPFKLVYHPVTENEFRTVIDYYGGKVRSTKWSQELSRAAIQTRNLSGVEIKYHEKNAVRRIDADTFLRPYQHFDVLLNQRGINKVSPKKTDNRMLERATLTADYSDFLSALKRSKSANLIDHDVTILDSVYEIASNATSSMSPESLLLTCDYTLYRFEREQSRRTRKKACVILPNILMQMLRPFIPSGDDFDKSFAQTFAIPEFRTIGSGAIQASSRILELLATFSEVPEKTAVALLSNDLLLEKLAPIDDDVEFQQIVEAEIVNQNNELLEENAELERKLLREREEKQKTEETLKQKVEAYDDTVQELSQKVTAVVQELDTEKSQKEKLAKELDIQKQAAIEQSERARNAEQKFAVTLHYVQMGLSIGLGILVAYFAPVIEPINTHRNVLPIRLLFGIVIFLVVYGYVRPEQRAKFWGGGAFVTLITTGIALLGA